MWYKDWFGSDLSCLQRVIAAQQEMDTGFDDQHPCDSDLPDLHLALCWILPQMFARKRAHRKKRARRQAQALVLKACAIACRDNPKGLPEGLGDALRALVSLTSLKSSRVAQKLLRRSSDPELMCFLEWPDDHFKRMFRMTPTLFDHIFEGIEDMITLSATNKKQTRNKKLIVDPKRKLAVALWYLTHGGDWTSLQAATSLGAATNRKYVIQVRLQMRSRESCARFAPPSSPHSKKNTCTSRPPKKWKLTRNCLRNVGGLIVCALQSTAHTPPTVLSNLHSKRITRITSTGTAC